MVVASKGRNQNHKYHNTSDQPPFIIQRSGKKHPDADAKRQQKKHRPPLQGRFLLVISEVKHSPFPKHKKQHGNTGAIDHLSNRQKLLPADHQKRDSRQDTQNHIKHPLESMKISVQNRIYHLSQRIIRRALAHAQHPGNHIARSRPSVQGDHS